MLRVVLEAPGVRWWGRLGVGLLGCGVWVLWVLVVGGVLAVGGLLVGLLVFFDF